MVVGVLQRGALPLQDVPGAEAGQDRADHRFADVASATGAVALDNGTERSQPADLHSVEKLSPAEREVLAQCLAHGDSGLLQLQTDEFLHQRQA